ncbi:MAG: hypothetical protein DMG45_18395 [Acidobacteria bacterium]|nr:MAG: hypothetical protein DMG45_18395 [Acidobacteriota bacterium]
MRALNLVQNMKTNVDRISEGLIRELLLRVQVKEHKRYAMEIYGDLTNWLAGEIKSIVEYRSIDLAIRRAQQGVPFSQGRVHYPRVSMGVHAAGVLT